MAKNSTPVKPQKAGKLAAGPECWPYEYEDIHQCWALEAIRHGNALILARYFREVDEIDPRVRRGFAEILNPTSNHFWRLHPSHRFRGKPAKRAKDFKRTFYAAVVPLTRLLSGPDPIDAACRLTLAEMLDPDSHHPLRLDFKQRNSGRPPLGPPRIDWLPLVPPPMQRDPAMQIALDAKRVRATKKGGSKVPLKRLYDGTSRATFFRRLKILSGTGKKRPFAKC
jgi:hypothetical protein